MKALVNYARWQGARLRLLGRDESAVWGELVFAEDDGERTVAFRFELNGRLLELKDEGGEGRVLRLDEMGVVVKKRLGD
jgi:hypothetical protein